MTGSYFLPDLISRGAKRLIFFVAASVVAHALTIAGVGPFQVAGPFSGSGSWRHELHATLAPPPADSGARVELDAAKDAPQDPAEDKDEPERIATAAPATGRGAGEAGLALPFPDRWLTAREVDVRAEPLVSVILQYPEHLRGKTMPGTVRLHLFIDEGGVVRKIQVAASEPAGVFDEAAKQAWARVRFKPALKDGAPVKSQKLIELTYVPE